MGDGMSTAAKLLADLTHLNIRLEAVGEQLRFYPRSAVTAELAERLRANKAELLVLLTEGNRKVLSASSAPSAAPMWSPFGPPDVRCRQCGSTGFTDFPIHAGQSMRRDCSRCGCFINFPVWYGRLQPSCN